MMNRLLSILAKAKVKRRIAGILIAVIMLCQLISAFAWTGGPVSGPKRIKSESGCLHNCWTDESCQDILKELFDEEPDIFNEIANEMDKYGWDAGTSGPSSDTGEEATGPAASASDAEKEEAEAATPSDADEEEAEAATPSDADEKAEAATPSDADEEEAEAATPSDADEEKATASNAKKKRSRYYKITEDGRLRLKDCEHRHDETCGYYAWKSVYQYKDDEVLIKAAMVAGKEEALPDGSVLVVERIEDPEEIRTIAEKVERETGQVYDCSQAYDIRFECDGMEVEPEDAAVQVQIKYKEAIPTGEPEETSGSETSEEPVKILHLTDDDQVQDVTGEISRNIMGDVRSATFETESFSVFILTRKIENGTLFSYENDDMVMTASVSEDAGIPADAKLVVDVIGEDDERYKDARGQLTRQAWTQENGEGDTIDIEEGSLEADVENLESSAQEILGTQLLLYDFCFINEFEEIVEVGEDIEIQLEIQYKGTKVLSEEKQKVTLYQLDQNMSPRKINGITEYTGSTLDSVRMQLNGIGMFAIENSNSQSPYSDETFFSSGGNYSLAYILQNFNIFTLENAHCGHTIGPVAVGGTGDFHSAIGGVTTGVKAEHKVNSFVKESFEHLKKEDGTLCSGSALSHYSPGSDAKLYISTGVQYDSMETRGILPGELIEKVRINEDYLEFDSAFRQIKSQVAALAENAQEAPSPSGTNWLGKILTLKDTAAYKVKDLNTLGLIDIEIDKNTRSIGNVIIVSEQKGVIDLPPVQIGGENLSSSESEPDGIGVVFILPNASTVTLYKQNPFMPGGHVIAPNARVQENRVGGSETIGNYNGCIIAKEVCCSSTEFHMHPYRGEFLDTGLQFELGKTVNGIQPKENETFTFVLQNMIKKGEVFEAGEVVEKRPNVGNNIIFTPIIYSEEDTYYYRIYEEKPQDAVNSGYIYDDDYYYIKVVTELIKDINEQLTKVKQITYWKADANGARKGEEIDVTVPTEFTALVDIDFTKDTNAPIIFKNKTGDQVTLPETGSTGTNRFAFAGMWLFMAGLLGMIYSGRRKTKTVI